MNEQSAPPGRLTANVMHFARVLRAAGMPIGPGQVIDALEAVQTAGLARRDDFYWALHSVFVTKREQHELFDQAFHIFWRNPELLERITALILPSIELPRQDTGEQALRRLAEALVSHEGPQREKGEPDFEVDATLTYSAQEQLRRKDFEQMSAAELAVAKQALARLRMSLQSVPTRRYRTAGSGPRIDMRASLKAGLRTGGAIVSLQRRNRVRRHPPLVVLCDVSGSMSRYSRMVLHFLHALTNEQDRVHTFVFGTRLTNVTRYLRYRDVDEALARVASVVTDWDGGTRIGHCLHEFNRQWSRRVLGQGAVALLITDGLDRDAGEGLGAEMERLHKSCRRLIWLNPLLRFAGFEPKSAGIRAILPHVDEFRPAHNIDSLMDLAAALSRPSTGLAPARQWEKAA